MKTLPVALAAHIDGRITSLSTALKITRSDGTVYGFTTHDVSDVVSGVTYSSSPGLRASGLALTAGAAVGNLELATLNDGTVFNVSDLRNGIWRNADYVIFRYNHSSIADGIDTLSVGTLGEIEIKDAEIMVELRDLRQYLQEEVGSVTSMTCRARLGDDKCRFDLNASPPRTVGSPLQAASVNGTLTAVSSNQTFTDSARTQEADWFGEGEIVFTSGDNVGVHRKIKSFAAGGQFTVAIPLFNDVVVGDSYTAYAGCRKRLVDCIQKFNNVLNFVGEPHRRGIDDITKSAA